MKNKTALKILLFSMVMAFISIHVVGLPSISFLLGGMTVFINNEYLNKDKRK